MAQERAALGSIHALLGALERRQRDSAAAAEAQQVLPSPKLTHVSQHVRPCWECVLPA